MRTPTAQPRPLRSRVLAAAAVTLLALVGLAACGDDGGDDVVAGSGNATTSSTAGSSTTAAAGGDDYSPGGGGGEATAGSTVVAKDFSLTSVTVAPGSKVEVENEGAAPHTVTADDGTFDTDRVEPGASTSFTAPTEPGDYAYHCEIHPAMTGTLTVQG